MKINQDSRLKNLAIVLWLAVELLASGCSSQGGMNSADLAKETDAALNKQNNKSGGQERLLQELSQIPQKEQLSAAPARDAYGFYILERINNEPYKFYVPPAEDSLTGEFPPANTYRVALVDYRRVDDGPYKLIDKNRTLPGFRLDADVVLIDHTIPAVVLRKTFHGERPTGPDKDAIYASIKDTDTEVLGKKPLDQIRKFLDGLPIKK